MDHSLTHEVYTHQNQHPHINTHRHKIKRTIVCTIITGSVVSIEYDPVGRFKLTHEDIELLSKELRDALIPFHQVKITGDLGEGIMITMYIPY